MNTLLQEVADTIRLISADQSTRFPTTVVKQRKGRGRYRHVNWLYLEIAGHGSYHLKTERIQLDTNSGNYHVFTEELQLSKVSMDTSPIGPGVMKDDQGNVQAKPDSYFPRIASNPSASNDPGLTVRDALRNPEAFRNFLEQGIRSLSL